MWLDLTLLDFWRWSESDLLGAPTRGRLADFVVATLLGASTVSPRTDRPTELLTADGISVRVKSATTVDREGKRNLAKVNFAPVPWRAPRRDRKGVTLLPPARAYVFALLGEAEKTGVNPLDLDSWRFYVPATARLEAKMINQRALSLQTLDALSGGFVQSQGLREAVRLAALAGDWPSKAR
jgi:hypothetical protein